jgi:hypothetical protein
MDYPAAGENLSRIAAIINDGQSALARVDH